jgi:hypothetical protein
MVNALGEYAECVIEGAGDERERMRMREERNRGRNQSEGGM